MRTVNGRLCALLGAVFHVVGCSGEPRQVRPDVLCAAAGGWAWFEQRLAEIQQGHQSRVAAAHEAYRQGLVLLPAEANAAERDFLLQECRRQALQADLLRDQAICVLAGQYVDRLNLFRRAHGNPDPGQADAEVESRVRHANSLKAVRVARRHQVRVRQEQNLRRATYASDCQEDARSATMTLIAGEAALRGFAPESYSEKSVAELICRTMDTLAPNKDTIDYLAFCRMMNALAHVGDEPWECRVVLAVCDHMAHHEVEYVRSFAISMASHLPPDLAVPFLASLATHPAPDLRAQASDLRDRILREQADKP